MPRRIPDYPDSYAGWNGIAQFVTLGLRSDGCQCRKSTS